MGQSMLALMLSAGGVLIAFGCSTGILCFSCWCLGGLQDSPVCLRWFLDGLFGVLWSPRRNVVVLVLIVVLVMVVVLFG